MTGVLTSRRENTINSEVGGCESAIKTLAPHSRGASNIPPPGRVVPKDKGEYRLSVLSPELVVTSMATIRILVVDDHPIVRQGLRTLLEAQPGWEVIDEASDGREGVEKVRELDPDVVLLDIGMPNMNGLEASRLIKKTAPRCEILILTQHDSPQMIQEAMVAGARGYVVKSQAPRDLLAAVEAVSQHKPFFSATNNPGHRH